MTVYSPTGKNTGAAVVVFPGGGYQILAIDLEGTEVCDWLTSKGITCCRAVLKSWIFASRPILLYLNLGFWVLGINGTESCRKQSALL
jgi:hypothetical protein